MSVQHVVSNPIQATVIIVDLRNFTPNLNAAERDTKGVNNFCYFLSKFYSLCLDVALIALPSSDRKSPPLYVSSTGDGVLMVIHHEEHARFGFLTTLILNNVLKTVCDEYNANRKISSDCPQTSFGIGVESGDVCRIQASQVPDREPLVDTYIGECINVAARAEGATKLYHRSNTIISENTNELLSNSFAQVSYRQLIRSAIDESKSDDVRLDAQDKMNQINRQLCLTFMHHHNLKGVDSPTPLFRLAHGSAIPSNPRFQKLVNSLAVDDEHQEEVFKYFQEFRERFES